MNKPRDTRRSTTVPRARVPGAVISTDPDFIQALRKILGAPESGVSLGLELEVPFTEIVDAQLQVLQRHRPGIVFLDLESDPHVGLRFAQFLLDSELTGALIGAGRELSPDLLLAAMQAGISEYLPKPISREAVAGALERTWRKMGKKIEGPDRQPGELILVFGAKGGAGCTTLATNLAIEIHRLTRKKTLLVDLDLELGETALLLGMEPRFSVADLIRNFHRVDANLLASYIERHESGVELLSAPYQPADVEAVSGDRVGQVLDFLARHYDYVVVDAPKTFTPATMAAFEAADEALLLATADLPSIRNLTRSLQLLKSIRPQEMMAEWLRLVVNRHDPRQLISLPEIEKTVKMKVFWSLRNDFASVMESINAGRPAAMNAKSNYAKDVRGLASRITGVPISEKSRGLFGSLLSPFRRNGRGGASKRGAPPKRRTSEARMSEGRTSEVRVDEH